jgi:hypothetical protein
MMLAPSWAESVAESSEVLLEDCLHDPTHRQLDDFVLQRGKGVSKGYQEGFGTALCLVATLLLDQ